MSQPIKAHTLQLNALEPENSESDNYGDLLGKIYKAIEENLLEDNLIINSVLKTSKKPGQNHEKFNKSLTQTCSCLQEIMNTSHGPSFTDWFPSFIVEIVKYGPRFLINPDLVNSDQTDTIIFGNLKSNLSNLIQQDQKVLEICLEIQKYFNFNIYHSYQEESKINIKDPFFNELQTNLVKKFSEPEAFAAIWDLQTCFIQEKLKTTLTTMSNLTEDQASEITYSKLTSWFSVLSDFLREDLVCYLEKVNLSINPHTDEEGNKDTPLFISSQKASLKRGSINNINPDTVKNIICDKKELTYSDEEESKKVPSNSQKEHQDGKEPTKDEENGSDSSISSIKPSSEVESPQDLDDHDKIRDILTTHFKTLKIDDEDFLNTFTDEFIETGLEAFSTLNGETKPSTFKKLLKLVMKDAELEKFCGASSVSKSHPFYKDIAEAYITNFISFNVNDSTIKSSCNKIAPKLLDSGYANFMDNFKGKKEAEGKSIYEKLLKDKLVNQFIQDSVKEDKNFKQDLIQRIFNLVIEKSEDEFKTKGEEILQYVLKTGSTDAFEGMDCSFSTKGLKKFQKSLKQFSVLSDLLCDIYTDFQKQVTNQLQKLLKKACSSDTNLQKKLLKVLTEKGIDQQFLQILGKMDEKASVKVFKKVIGDEDIQIFLLTKNVPNFRSYLYPIIEQYISDQDEFPINEFMIQFSKEGSLCLKNFTSHFTVEPYVIIETLLKESLIPTKFFKIQENPEETLIASANINELLSNMIERFELKIKMSLETFNGLEDFVFIGNPSNQKEENPGKLNFENIFLDTLRLYSSDFGQFKIGIFKLINYFIKREQCLTELGQTISFNSTSHKKEGLCLKLFLHNMYLNSDPILREKMVLLLSTSNPIPFMIPEPSKNNNDLGYKFIPEAYWVLDETKTHIFSFGLGKSKGKSSLLNNIFMTTFECSNNSPFFKNSIDLQTDKYFKTHKRNIYVLDSHGEMNTGPLDKCFKLFSNYIIHVDEQSLRSNSKMLSEFVSILAEKHKGITLNVFVFIRDVQSSEELKVNCINSNHKQEWLNIKNCWKNVTLHVYTFPNLQGSNEMAFFSKLTRDHMIDVLHSKKPSQTNLKGEFLKLLTREEQDKIREICNSVDGLVQNIIKFIQKEGNDSTDIFKLYPLFHQICLIDSQLRRTQLLDINYQKNCKELEEKRFHLKHRLDGIDKTDRGEALQLFEKIILAENRVSIINLFITKLKENLDKITSTWPSQKENCAQAIHNSINDEKKKTEFQKKEQDLADKIDSKLISVEYFWRELSLFLDYNDSKDPYSTYHIIEAYQFFILNGYPFEIVDGDNYYFPHKFLKETLENIAQSSRVFVISILGPQNSGKSTLLNYLFGCSFNVKDGRCTKGIYGTLIKSIIPEYDYFLLIDTEGLQSIEKGDSEYDRKITLFCLAVSQIVLFNVKDEINDDMKKLLQICAFSLQNLKLAHIPQPNIFFVLNQKADPNIKNHIASIRKIQEVLTEKTVDSGCLVNIPEDHFELLPAAFNNNSIDINRGKFHWSYHRTSNEFLSRVIGLGMKLQENAKASEIKPKMDKLPFGNLCEWIEFAYNTFKIINKYPDLTLFKDLNEKQCYEKSKAYIVQLVETELNEDKKKELPKDIIPLRKDVRKYLSQWFVPVRSLLLDKFEDFCKKGGFPSNVRELGKKYIEVLLNHYEDMWSYEFSLQNYQEGMKSSKINGLDSIKNTIKDIALKGEILTEDQASERFEDLYKSILDNLSRSINLESIKEEFLSFTIQSLKMHGPSLPEVQSIKKYTLEDLDKLIQEFTQDQYFLSDSESTLSTSKNFLKKGIQFNFFNNEAIYQDLGTFDRNLNVLVYNLEKIQHKYTSKLEESLENKAKIEVYIKNSYKNFMHKFYDWCKGKKNSMPVINPSNIKPLNISKLDDIMTLFDTKYSEIIQEPERPLDFTEPFRKLVHDSLLGFSELKSTKYFDFEELYILVIEKIKNMLQGYNSNGSRDEMIQNLTAYIAEVIVKPCNEDLNVFGLKLSQKTIGSFYILAIKMFFEARFEQYKHSMDQIFDEVIKQKESQKKFFITSVIQDDQKDQEVAKMLLQKLETHLLSFSKQEAQRSFANRINTIENRISRRALQKELDSILGPAVDEVWLERYITEPTEIILERFNEIWEENENMALLEANQILKGQEELLRAIRFSLENLKQILLSTEGFIPHVDNIFYASGGDLCQNVYLKGQAALNFIFCFITNKRFESIDINDIKFELISLEKSQLHLHAAKLNSSQLEALEEFGSEFKGYSISNLLYFITSFVGGLNGLEKTFLNKSFCLDELGQGNIYQTYVERARGCHVSCPCCKRPCDAEHFKIKDQVGSMLNKHCCELGHQFRGMNGFRMEYTNEASLRVCEDMKDQEQIVHKGVRMTWRKFKEKYPDWDFNTVHLEQQELLAIRSRFSFVWRNIGRSLCTKHGTIYTEFNATDRDKQLLHQLHYILVLDASSSMKGAPWCELIESVKEFLSIREKEGLEDLVSCVVFGSTAKNVFIKQKPSKKLADLINYQGGTTDFCAALKEVIRIMARQISGKYIIVFMSDGAPNSYPESELQTLAQSYHKNIEDFWTIGFGAQDFILLEQMAEELGGKYKNPGDAHELRKVFVEIANS